jgi:hypothetical protein
MPNMLLSEILVAIQEKKIQYGTINVEFVFHEGKICHYFLNVSEKHKVEESDE